MQRVVLDTNILVSALLTPAGVSAKIFDIFETEQIDIYYSKGIMDEYEDVLFRQKFNFDLRKIHRTLEKIEKLGIFVVPQVSGILLPDESDRPFYDTAKTCDAFLVTGNGRHYPLEQRVVTPKQFLELIVSF
jgi:putative PIN family toxin of toxin-antitoxin system